MTRENARAISQNTVFKTEQVLLTAEKISNNYKFLLENQQLNTDSLLQYTQLIVKNNPAVLGCAIAFAPNYFPEKGRYFSPYTYRYNDSIISMNLGNENYEYFVMDWYQIPATMGQAYWSEPYFDTGGSDALVTTYSVPFSLNRDASEGVSGIITIDLSLNWLTDIVASVHVMETGYASVISRNGTYVTHPDKHLIMNQTIFSYAAELDNPALREMGRSMQSGETDFVEIELQGKEWFFSYTPLLPSNWSLAVAFPKDEMYAPLRQIGWVLLIIVSIGLLLLTYIVIRIVRKQIAPLRLFAASAKEVAGGNFEAKLPHITTKDEMHDLHGSFVYMQKELKNYMAHLQETTSAKEKIESELRIAREIQMGMIPKIFPPFPNLTEIDLYALLEPAKEVGGDLYDFFMIDDKHLCFAIGDVSGKGVPASLFMAVTRTLLRSVAPQEHAPANIVNALNKSLSSGNESSMFVTFFLGIVNLESGHLRYTNAGHNPPVLLSADQQTKMFEITEDIPIGLFEDFQYQEKERHLNPNDCLFMYTDGITEAENVQTELYSDQRLMDCLSGLGKRTPKALIEGVTSDVSQHVQAHYQSDDLTMLSIIYYGK